MMRAETAAIGALLFAKTQAAAEAVCEADIKGWIVVERMTCSRSTAIATALKHAGAETVTQLDVNWSYPKFVLFQADSGSSLRKAVALAKGFEFSEDEYIRKRSMRDFFYLMPKKPADKSARN